MSNPTDPEKPKKLSLKLKNKTPEDSSPASPPAEAPEEEKKEETSTTAVPMSLKLKPKEPTPEPAANDVAAEKPAEETKLAEKSFSAPLEPVISPEEEPPVNPEPVEEAPRAKLSVQKKESAPAPPAFPAEKPAMPKETPPPIPKAAAPAVENPAPVLDAEPPAEEKKSPKKKSIFLPFLLFLLVVAGIGGAIYYFVTKLTESNPLASFSLQEKPADSASTTAEVPLSPVKSPIQKAVYVATPVPLEEVEPLPVAAKTPPPARTIQAEPIAVAPKTSDGSAKMDTPVAIDSPEMKTTVPPDPAVEKWLKDLEIQAILGFGETGKLYIDGTTYAAKEPIVGSRAIYFVEITKTHIIFEDGKGAQYLKARSARYE